MIISTAIFKQLDGLFLPGTMTGFSFLFLYQLVSMTKGFLLLLFES